MGSIALNDVVDGMRERGWDCEGAQFEDGSIRFAIRHATEGRHGMRFMNGIREQDGFRTAQDVVDQLDYNFNAWIKGRKMRREAGHKV